MIRCPNCQSDRPFTEIFCEGVIDNKSCGWNLLDELINQSSRRSVPLNLAPVISLRCTNGHEMAATDFLCMVCGADAASEKNQTLDEKAETTDNSIIDGWRLLHPMENFSGVCERYVVEEINHNRRAMLTLYYQGAEPDPAIYDVLKRISLKHIPEIYQTGRWDNRAYEITEILTGGSLSDVGFVVSDLKMIHHIVDELGQALDSLSEMGLRHRNLQPSALLIREKEPLDLVIGHFGSARLSDFDLDIVSPLEITRYMAPEAIAGGVAAASDWWSLGIILLEQITQGKCFEGINARAFLIHLLANGVALPENLDPSLNLLLRGLLARDRHQRWQWKQIKAWLAGEAVSAPPAASASGENSAAPGIELGRRTYNQPSQFALAAAETQNWNQARDLFVRGSLLTWAQAAGVLEKPLSGLRQIVQQPSLTDDVRLMLALKLLNSELPLIYQGEIVTPGWLLQHPLEGYELMSGVVPDLLDQMNTENWLKQLKQRAIAVRLRIKNLEITADENSLRINLLSTSTARLAAIWEERRRLFPDSPHTGLLTIIERSHISEEDLIILLSADLAQFRSRDTILSEVNQLLKKQKMQEINTQYIHEQLSRPRLEILQTLNERVSGFARCSYAALNDWADQFRIERRITIVHALCLLAVPPKEWKIPAEQQYVANILDLFEQRISSSVMRGPLVRMTITKTSARLDIAELGTERVTATSILNHLLQRNLQSITLDPGIFSVSNNAMAYNLDLRLQALSRHNMLYKRDTGIDGLYLGFPFLLIRDAKGYAKTRVAPLLLWPVHLLLKPGNRGLVSLSFDNDREEVRLNPAFESLLGVETTKEWRKATDELLSRSALNITEVMDAFGLLVKSKNRELQLFQNICIELEPRTEVLDCSAVLFHVTFMGQAIGEDIKQLKNLAIAGTGLETVLKANPIVPAEKMTANDSEFARYFTLSSDPSQEASVLQARQAPGLLIEGPPGTGKSQTIVNMVGDTIGRRESMLIVCQKYAALEVVHKRLVAEGLGDRIVMITDVNKDRNPIIKAIREQIETLYRRPANPSIVIQHKRETLAARIESLESELDFYHQALHHIQDKSGLSYRSLLGELVELESPTTPLNLPDVRQLLSSMSSPELAALEETMAPLVRYWLPAEFEESPLHALQIFSPEKSLIEEFTAILNQLLSAERLRCQLLQSQPVKMDIDDPEPHRNWLNQYSETLLSLDDLQRTQLARWLLLFRNHNSNNIPNEGSDLLNQLEKILAESKQSPVQFFDSLFSPSLIFLNDKALKRVAAIALEMTLPKPWYSKCNLLRFFREKELQHFFKIRNDNISFSRLSSLIYACQLETYWRPLRKRLTLINQQLGLTSIAVDAGVSLHAEASATHVMLKQAATIAANLALAPLFSVWDKVILKASRDEVQQLISDFESAFTHCEARQTSLGLLGQLNQWMTKEWIADYRDTIMSKASFEKIESIKMALPILESFFYFKKRSSHLTENAFKIFKLLRKISSQLSVMPLENLENEFRRILNHEVRLFWKQSIEQTNPVLALSRIDIESKVAHLAALDVEMRMLNRQLLKEDFDMTVIARPANWEGITRLTGQRARRLREFIEQASELGLMKLRPIWLMNPDVASRVLPLKSAFFDLVVYDEASQIRVEHALPSLYRGKRTIVSGDEKQMPPTAFFASKAENDEAEVFDGEVLDLDATDEERNIFEENWNRHEIKDCPDLLQLARTKLPNTTLKIHYRSQYRELIEFSNASFYSNNLHVPVRHPDATIKRVRPIELVYANTVYQEQTNPGEAKKIAEILEKIWKENSQRPSVGIVTFNRKQADLIEDQLELRAQEDDFFRQVYTQERERMDDGEDMGIFVKNLENVQGDERDIIIFSSTFGKNAQGVFRRNFGVLGQMGGERRLNVAVTRARQKVIMVTSMLIDEVSDILSTRRALSSPRDYLQAYLEYARLISLGEMDSSRNLLKRIKYSDMDQVKDDAVLFEDGIKKSVADYIEMLGWQVTRSDEQDAFSVDLAIENPITGLFAIGIECDAPCHELLTKARAREIWRPKVLSRAISTIYRVSSQAWYQDPINERERLHSAIKHAFAKED